MIKTLSARGNRWLAGTDTHMREVLKLAPLSLVVKALGGVAAFGLNVVLARAIGAEGAGAYYIALTAAMITAMIGRVGLETAAIRFTAAHVEQGDWPGVAGLYRRSVRITVLGSSVAALALIACGDLVARYFFSNPSLGGAFRLAAIGVVPLSLSVLLVGFLRGVKRAAGASFVESLGIPLVTLGAFFVLRNGGNAARAINATTFATVVVAACAVALWRRAAPEVKGAGGTVDVGELLRVSRPLFWISSMNVVMQFADTLMVGAIAGQASAGVYAAALRAGIVTNMILTAVTSVVAPQFSALWVREDRAAIGKLARSSALLMTIASLPVLVPLIVAPGPIMGIFGEGFSRGANALRVIAAGQLLQTAMGAVGYLLAMTGHQKAMRNIMLCSAALFIALNAILIPRFGIDGAAWSYSISLVVMNVIKSALVYRRLGVIVVPGLRTKGVRGAV